MSRSAKTIVALSVLLCLNASSADRYVDSGAGGGGDGSIGSPWNSIAFITGMSTGDNLYFKRGTITTGQLNVSWSGTSSNAPSVIGAYGSGDAPILSGTNTTTILQPSSSARHNIYVTDLVLRFATNSVVRVRSQNRNWTITNCVIENSITSHGLSLDCQFFSLINSQVRSNGNSGSSHGMYLDTSGSGTATNYVIKGCVIHDNSGDGIKINSGNVSRIENIVLDGNTIFRNGNNGINNEAAERGRIVNNVIYDNGGTYDGWAINLSDNAGTFEARSNYIAHNTILHGRPGYAALRADTGSAGHTATNNIIECSGTAFYLEAGTSGAIESDFNLFYGGTANWKNGGTTYTSLANWQAAGFDASSIAGSDPLLTNYRLTASSPAIDTGTATEVTLDVDGNSRPQGAGWDIGADEFFLSPTIVTNNASGARVMGFRGLGMSVLPIPSVNTTADLWQAFEFTDPTVANLDANDNTSTGTWLTNDNTVLMSISTSGERALTGTINGSSDTGHTRGLRKSHTANDTANVQFDLGGSAVGTISAGTWWKFVGPTPGASKCILLFAYSGGTVAEVLMNTTTKTVGFSGGSNNGVALVTDTWYWITAKIVKNSTSYISVYDTTGTLVGTEVTGTAANQDTRFISLGRGLNETADNSILVYWDDLVLDWTDATYPLGL